MGTAVKVFFTGGGGLDWSSISGGYDFCPHQHIEPMIQEYLQNCSRSIKKMVILSYTNPCWSCTKEIYDFVNQNRINLVYKFATLRQFSPLRPFYLSLVYMNELTIQGKFDIFMIDELHRWQRITGNFTEDFLLSEEKRNFDENLCQAQSLIENERQSIENWEIVPTSNWKSFSSILMYFDIETTGFHQRAEIIKISALTETGERFMTYIWPYGNISPLAAENNGLTKHGNGLYFHGDIVVCQKKTVAMGNFLRWAASLGKKLVLVNHMIENFELLHMRNVMSRQQRDVFERTVVGYIDTLRLFRKEFQGLQSYSKPALYEEFLGRRYKGKGDINECQSLVELLDAADVSQFQLEKYFRPNPFHS